MEKQKHQTRLNERVRLKLDGQDGLYIYAAAGAPGWVRKQDHDSMGYPTIFIEWDKNHWSYNGEPDRWTMEAHFEPEERAVSDVPEGMDPDLAERFAAFLEFERNSKAIEDREPDEPSIEDQYNATVGRVMEQLRDADSFILVTVNSVSEVELVPKTLSFYKTAESGLVAEMYIAKLTAASSEELVINEVRRIIAEKKAGQ